MNVCNIEYDNELNNRLSTRWFPSNSLTPQFDERPVSTKYTFFQTVEEKPIINTPKLQYVNYSPSNVFNPGSRAPSDFFFNNVDLESKLRNQFMALQKSNQSVYVPELTSSLYENSYVYKKEYSPTDCKTNVNNNIVANNTFNNFTRYNLRK